ncbi:MAG TPA: hypothetical protein VLE02_01085 [Nitrosarchaeum sp.]|nr:hypothetical protein [Nitrosarchaeum sp.]
MVNDIELQIITGNVVYYTLLSTTRVVDAQQVVVHDLSKLKILFKDVLSNMIKLRLINEITVGTAPIFYMCNSKSTKYYPQGGTIDEIIPLIANEIENFIDSKGVTKIRGMEGVDINILKTIVNKITVKFTIVHIRPDIKPINIVVRPYTKFQVCANAYAAQIYQSPLALTFSYKEKHINFNDIISDVGIQDGDSVFVQKNV